MEAEADSNQIRLVCIGSDDDYTPVHVRKWMETQPLENIDMDIQFESELSNGLALLDGGDVDLIAISAQAWYESEKPRGVTVATAIPVEMKITYWSLMIDHTICLTNQSS